MASWCLTFRRGETTRSFPIRPYLAGSALTALVLMLTAYVGATAYLIYRDDLLGAAVSRQVTMQYAYEERIAALRSEIDRLTSRHVVQTAGVEEQLAALLEQQAMIERRQSALDQLIDKAQVVGVDVADGAATTQLLPVASGAGVRPLLSGVQSSLKNAEADQSELLDALGAAAEREAERISSALTPIGLELGGPEVEGSEPQGGPFVPAAGLHFVERTALLERALDDLDTLRRSADAMPVRMPVKALYLSSRFGNRIDPFLKRPAFHLGLDFVAEAGTTVLATAPGTVVSAGWNGGYGKMVEIEHAGGIVTRYGHLSDILVAPGTLIQAGTAIGLVGSTGRSTGPHLHYETRRDGKAVNPSVYLTAGKALRHVL